MPEGLRKFAMAKDSPKIVSLKPIDAENMILNLINQTQLQIGHTKSAQDGFTNAVAAGSIYEFIKTRFNTLTVEELKLAFLRHFIDTEGINDQVNLKSAVSAVKNYVNDENKKRAMAEWNKLIHLVQIREKTEAEKEAIELDGAIHFFEEYSTNGMLNQILKKPDRLCAIFYDRLKAKGLINQSTELRQRLYEQAEKEYHEFLAKSYQRKQIKNKDLSNILEVALKDNKPFVSMVKRIALLEYFDQLIKENKQLKELLNADFTI